MKTRPLLLLAGLFHSAAPAPAASTWSWVSASNPARAGDAVLADPAPGEAEVRLIPASPGARLDPLRPRSVVAILLPPAEAEAAAPAEMIPEEARWPDQEGVIAETHLHATPTARNPWESPSKVKAKGRTATFLFGGYIGGGAAGPVALVNGRGHRRGEELDGFTIARIAPAGVVLARGGALYVLPPRRRVTIELQEP
jgi:hypothetical protein